MAAPAVLTIEPGTVIYGGDTRATLFIQRGAKIMADGTDRRPIVFTSPQRVGSRAQLDWGSLVVLGNAPINVAVGTAFLEGLPSTPGYNYGGTNAADSSGVLRYVRLEFGGFPIATDREINGLTLGGVGSGTVIDHGTHQDLMDRSAPYRALVEAFEADREGTRSIVGSAGGGE